MKNKQIKRKEKPKFKAEVVQEDRTVTVKTKPGKVLHKTDVRR